MDKDQILSKALSVTPVDGSLSTMQMFKKIFDASNPELSKLSDEERRQYEYNLGWALKGKMEIGEYEHYQLGGWKNWL